MDTKMLSDCFLIVQIETLSLMEGIIISGVHLCWFALMDTKMLSNSFSTVQIEILSWMEEMMLLVIVKWWIDESSNTGCPNKFQLL